MSTSNTPAWQATAVEEAVRGRAKMIEGPSWSRARRSAAFLLLLCVLLVAAADVLFYKQTLGWSGALFGALLLLAITLRSGRYLTRWPGLIITAGFIVACLTIVEQPGPLRIIMAILGVTALAIIKTRGWTASVAAWVGRWLELTCRCVVQPLLDVGLGGRWARRHPNRTPRWQRHAVAWIIPVLLSAVFVGLFAAANPIISTWLGHANTSIQRFIANIGEYLSIGRASLWLVTGFIAWSLLRGRTRSALGDATLDSRLFVTSAAAGPWPSAGAIVRCLALFNIVFAVQMGLDVATVLTHGATLPEGVSIKEYAHRGAYPLVATALLAATFVLITFRTGSFDEGAARKMKTARLLVCAWIGQNILLTASAMWRLREYVEAYGLTHLRVAAGVWMLLVAAGLMWIIVRIVTRRSNAWLLRVNVVTLVTTLMLCCLPNWDGIIASYDVRNCMEMKGPGPRIDLEYLRGLGPESIPTLLWLSQQLGDDPVGHQANQYAVELQGELNQQLQNWQGWTLRRSRLAERIGQAATRLSKA